MPSEYRFRRLPFWAAAIAVLALAALPASAAAKGTAHGPRVLIALLPNGTPVEALERAPAIAPGLLSAGIDGVSPEQTYLDVTQGNRIDDDLYDEPLPEVEPLGTRVPGWSRIVDRADAAPADLVPGLLSSAIRQSGQTLAADFGLMLPSLLAADRGGRMLRFGGPGPGPGAGFGRCSAAVCVRDIEVSQLFRLSSALRAGELLIAIERPPPAPDHQLTIGIAGFGFAGNLTSDSTRLRGYVLSTDVAPTVLDHLGVPVPSQMSGEPIHSEGSRDVSAVASLQDRLASIIDRRGSVIGLSALIWIALGLLAAAISRGALARPAMQMAALSGIYLPATLLVGAALEPSLAVEQLIVAVGAPLLAAATLLLAPGYRALALACAVTVGAFAVDVIVGSPLTPLSLIGPDPGLGVRFYGIGNELEATLTPLVLVGIGAALTALRPDLAPRPAATVFLVAGLLLAFVFASGRFGADVGAAIVLPAGAAAAAASLTAARRGALLVIAVPLAALAALALLDLLLGGDSHLTRSVLDAGGLHDLGDVAERRLRLSAHSFARGLDAPLFWIALVGIAVAVHWRRRILAWFEPTPALRAGFVGAVVAVVVATLANDSGVLLLEVGTIYLLLGAGFAWTQAGSEVPGSEGEIRHEPPPRPA